MKEVSRGMFIALITYFKHWERSSLTNFKAHTLEQKIIPESSRQQERIKLNAKINKNKIKKYKASMKQTSYFEKNQ